MILVLAGQEKNTKNVVERINIGIEYKRAQPAF